MFITLLIVGLYIGIPVILDDQKEEVENKNYKLTAIAASFEGIHSVDFQRFLAQQ